MHQSHHCKEAAVPVGEHRLNAAKAQYVQESFMSQKERALCAFAPESNGIGQCCDGRRVAPNKATTKINPTEAVFLRVHVPVPCQHKMTYCDSSTTNAICPILFDTAYSKLLLISSGENFPFPLPFLNTLPNELAIIVDLSPSLL